MIVRSMVGAVVPNAEAGARPVTTSMPHRWIMSRESVISMRLRAVVYAASVTGRLTRAALAAPPTVGRVVALSRCPGRGWRQTLERETSARIQRGPTLPISHQLRRLVAVMIRTFNRKCRNCLGLATTSTRCLRNRTKQPVFSPEACLAHR